MCTKYGFIALFICVAPLSLAAKTQHAEPVGLHQPSRLDTSAYLQKSILAVRNLKRIAGWGVAQDQLKAVKRLSEKMTSDYIKLDDELVKLAKQLQIEIPKSKTEGAFNPDGRVEPMPENLRDTIRIQKDGKTMTDEVDRQTMLAGEEFEKMMLDLMKMKGAAGQSQFKQMAIAECERLVQNLSKWLELMPGANASAFLSMAKKHHQELQRL
jgi:hypothetical protein